MPDKVHKKFGDEDEPTTGSEQKPAASTQNVSKSPGLGQTNGVKRFRDGSPKPTSSPTKSPDSDEHDATKKPQANSGAARNHDTSGANGVQAKKARTDTNSKGVTGAGVRNTAFTNGLQGRPNGQKPKLNGVGKPAQQRQPTENLRKLAAQLEKTRKELPIWKKKADIRWALRNDDVLLLNGETGSGKSTQVPQFLCIEPWCKRQKVKVENKDGREEEIAVGGQIVITQPRRVAAMTLAHRVAREMGSPLVKGVPGEVGYSVRFESIVPQGTKIKFVTEGVLLQEMLHDPCLKKYSAVIIDEIHERSVDVDLIAGFLRKLVHGDKKGRGGIPLKLVVMSATLDLGGIEAFFAKPDTQSEYKPGNNHGRIFAQHLLEFEVDGDIESDQSRRTSGGSFSSWDGFSDTDNCKREPSPNKSANATPSSSKESNKLLSKTPITNGASPSITNGKHAVKGGKSEKSVSRADAETDIADDGTPKNGVAVEYVEGRQYEVGITYEAKPSPDYLHNMLQTILRIHVSEPLPGDILCFLTGQDEIETLQAQLESYAEKLVKDLPSMKVLPLYGSLPAPAQQEAFEPVKEKRTRKVVLATNIAETSVTVSGVRYVVDCGKSKVKQYRPRLGMESLLAKPISRVSAIQRAGRAGREAKGKCYRIYTEPDYLKLDQDELPEILRSDVLDAVLKMKARGVEDPLTFPLMDSPDAVAMGKALLQLHAMSALDDNGKLTEVGKNMAAFPLPAAYGRVLIAAAEALSDVLLEAIDVISCLTTDSEVYLQPKSEEDQEVIEENRNDIQRREGDVITLLTTMQRYAAEPTDRNEWCRKRLVSIKAMKMAMNIRKQLRQMCLQAKLLAEAPPADPQPFEPITPERAEVLLKAFLKAFATKTAVLAPDASYLTTQGRNTISIHPSSVLHGRKVEAIMFLDHVFTAKNYAKKVSAIQADWIFESLEI